MYVQGTLRCAHRACTSDLAGVLRGPDVSWFGLVVSQRQLGELPEGHHHGVLHQTQPVLHVASSLDLLQGGREGGRERERGREGERGREVRKRRGKWKG